MWNRDAFEGLVVDRFEDCLHVLNRDRIFAIRFDEINDSKLNTFEKQFSDLFHDRHRPSSSSSSQSSSDQTPYRSTIL